MSEHMPLAERMRPECFSAFVGQEHVTSVLSQMVANGSIPSMILWGPPGTGKTTLATLVANALDLPFYTLSAINAGVKDVRAVIDTAQKQGRAILFIDEIHRFSKSQQDSLLGAVEKGTITLIGATTENPSFEVIAPLLSRCQTYVLESLGKDQLLGIVEQALAEDEQLKTKQVEVKEYNALLRLSGGDARKLLNLVELLSESGQGGVAITDELVMQVVQQKMARYDKGGEQHYDIISAFIKSIRGSDPNAALYYLARMIEGGEDPSFIARRLLILASEDIGNANPTALVLANNCFQAVNVIGYPECELILSQAVIYLASSAKSNASYAAIKAAKKAVKETGDLSVPLHLRNAPTQLMEELGYGNEYKYAHSFEENFVDQEFLPDQLSGVKFYEPQKNNREQEIRSRLQSLWGNKYQY